MKKKFCFIMASLYILFSLTSACAAGYTLPQKMLKQLQVGSGLTGSFVIHGNAASEKQPFLNSIQNSEFEIVGIKTDDYLHYHIYQSVDSDKMTIPAELLNLNDRYYFRSSFFDGTAYAAPDADQIISLLLKLNNGNPPAFASLLKLLLFGDGEGSTFPDTSSLEKRIDLWLAGFTPVTSIQKDDLSVPSLTEKFTIPVDSMFNAITELIQYVSQNDTALSALRSVLSEEQIALYFNPDLAYYYIDAMKQLDFQDDIIFTRTVSTMGELLESTLKLPLDEEKTGYSSIEIHNDDQRKTLQIAGTKGTLFIDLPLNFSLEDSEFDRTVHFVLIRSENTSEKNLALNISIQKKHDEHNDPEETKTYEINRYMIRMTQDTSVLPDGISADIFSEMEPVVADVELLYSSKSQIYSSSTSLEFSVSVVHGKYQYSVTGKVKTTSPEKIQTEYAWALTDFYPDTAVSTTAYSFADFVGLVSGWMEKANELLIRTPGEIKQADPE